MSCCGQKRRELSETEASQPRPAAPSASGRKPAQLEAAMLAFLARRARSGPANSRGRAHAPRSVR
jgi:hypothetical protein